jgi:hypothetical protein
VRDLHSLATIKSSAGLGDVVRTHPAALAVSASGGWFSFRRLSSTVIK